MPTFQVTSPDGATYEVNGPDGATEDDAIAYVKNGMTPPPQKAAPQTPEMPAQGDQSFDYLGDTGKAFTSAKDDLVESARMAFPSAQERESQDQANQGKYGTVAGIAKSAILDPAARLGDALKIPVDAIGMLAAPLTGALHAGLGSILARIPGMADNQTLTPGQQDAIQNNPVAKGISAIGMSVPGIPPGKSAKQAADALIDKAAMFAAPKGMAGGLQGVANAADAAAAAKAQEVIAANQAKIAKNPALVQAREAGYVVHPAEVSVPGMVADAASGFGGKIKTQQAASVRNQEITNGIAAKELGLPADATLDDATFSGVRAKAADAYKVIQNSASTLPTGRVVADNQFLNDIAGLDSKSADFVQDFPEAAAKRSAGVADIQRDVLKSDFSPRAGVEMIRNLRDDARVNLKNWGDADKIRLGYAQRDAANAIEDLIDRNLTAAGNADAVQNYRDARQLIAKSHDIESVTDAGNVDARKLAALGNKRPLTGGLKTIADVATAFPKSMQLPAKFGGVEKHSVLDAFTSAMLGGSALFSGHPGLAVGAALPYIRPYARDLALSNLLQDRLLGLQKPGNLGPVIRKGVVPALTYGNGLTGPDYLRSLLPPGQGIPAPLSPYPPNQQ